MEKYVKIAEAINAKLGDGYEVSYHEAKKNSGVILYGMAIQKKGDKVAPLFYVNDIPEDQVVDVIVNRYKDFISKSKNEFPDADKIKNLISKDGILNNVFPTLVNRNMNKDRLDSIMHRPYLDLDLEITYKVPADKGAYITINNEIAKLVGLTENEIYDAALNNIQGKAELKSITEMIPIEVEGEVRENPLVFVITNKDDCCGAGMILDKEVMDFLNDKIGDFFVIPSSTHELLIIPECMGDADRFKEVIADINKTSLEDNEILSNNLYICRNGKMEVA